MADETNGQFYNAMDAYDIKTIYRQLASLFVNQYALTYDSGLVAGENGSLFVEASDPTHPQIKGDATEEITPCPTP